MSYSHMSEFAHPPVLTILFLPRDTVHSAVYMPFCGVCLRIYHFDVLYQNMYCILKLFSPSDNLPKKVNHSRSFEMTLLSRACVSRY